MNYLGLAIFVSILSYIICNEEFCYSNTCNETPTNRYLLYDINPSEGFNLRRDVYMRFAILAYKLKKSKQSNLNNYKLVLPPWSHLIHWQHRDVPEHIPWAYYFDLDSLQRFAPVIEMYQFFDEMNRKYSKIMIDEVYILQHFKDMFETGNFQDRMELGDCQRDYHTPFFYYKNITSDNIRCLSYHGPATKLKQLLQNSTAKTILIHHAEVALHELFGDRLYWQTRRSMRFNKELHRIATGFRRDFLNSTDPIDTNLPEDWRDEKPKRSTKGGPYLSVHLRRRDFLHGRSNELPTIQAIIQQIRENLEKLQLDTVFIATDASTTEYGEISKTLQENYRVFKYKPSHEIKAKYKDGGVAIIEQIICSYARYFIGTHESTFSFRIQEEREILGFPTQTTFNSFCKDDNCAQPSVWKIVY